MTTRERIILLESPMLAADALTLLAHDDAMAIAEGRLFADRRRVERGDQLLDRGQRVTWHAARSTHEHSTLVDRLVVQRAEGFVAVSKPAGWSSEPDRTGSSTSLRERLADALGTSEVHVLTRLDVGVSGLVVAATNAESRRRWGSQTSRGSHRRYLAILAGQLPSSGTWRGAVEGGPGRGQARVAVTHFRCLAQRPLAQGVSLGDRRSGDVISLVSFRPETGHRHQLRIHSARACVPIVGDRRYGGPDRFIDADGRVQRLERIYLHALDARVQLSNGAYWNPSCPLTEDFRELWKLLGGTEGDLTEESQ